MEREVKWFLGGFFDLPVDEEGLNLQELVGGEEGFLFKDESGKLGCHGDSDITCLAVRPRFLSEMADEGSECISGK